MTTRRLCALALAMLPLWSEEGFELTARRRRMGALLIVIALTGACTDSSGSSTTTSTESSVTIGGGTTQDVGTAMDNALGGTQAVQDFVIHIDMSLQTDDGPVSFYQEVLDRAESGAGEPVDLAGGFTLAEVDSLEGEVIDAEGEVLPNLSVDFGLLGATRDRLEEAQRRLGAELVAAREGQLAEALTTVDPVHERLLVEIVSADYSQARTHAGPGDRLTVDLTSISKIEPGDQLSSGSFFGQTLPGDPSMEVGMSALELFEYRWNHGLIRMLGDGAGVSLVLDDTLEAVAGSTIVTQEMKAALLFGAGVRGATSGVRFAEDILAGSRGRPVADDDGVFYMNTRGEIVFGCGDGGCAGTTGLFLDSDGHIKSGCIDGVGCLISLSDEEFILAMSAAESLAACARLASALNARNESGGISVAELGVDQVDTNGSDAVEGRTTTGDETTMTPTRPTPPEPVSCARPPSTSGFPKAPSGGAWGDPHIRTIDGNFYDNMATGEFLAFDNGVAVIQMRTEPWPGQDSVSLSTAFAFRVGEHTVSVHAGGHTWIDGEEAQLTRGETIAVGDGELLRWEGGWVLVWPDDTVARVYLRTAALILVVTPSDRPSFGMLGDNDGDPDNDLVTRSGVQLEPNADGDFDTFYPTYIDSWRITDEESRFHYEPGESTASFIVEGFPAVREAASNLDPETRGDAEEVCASVGVTGEQHFESCVLDVGLTGDTSFAYDTFVMQTSAATPEPDGDQGTAVVRPSVNGANIVSIGDLTVEFGANPPIQDPNGVRPKWQCDVTDGSFHATSVFDESPTRKFEVTIEYLDAATSGTGTERFTLIMKLNAVEHAWVLNWNSEFADAIDSLSLEGSTLSATGVAYLNEPIAQGVGPLSVLPDDAELRPFSLEATCDQ